MEVRDLMNTAPATLAPEASLAVALEHMTQSRSRHVVVLKAEQVVGILSDRDLAMYYDPDRMTADRWEQASIADLMTADPVSIGSGAGISAAAQLLIKTAVSALPVIDNGQLVGILSEKDFVRHFANQS